MSTGHRPFVNIGEDFPDGYRAMLAFERAVRGGPLDPTLYELVKLRASQLNGCAYCVDMHHKDARAAGESEERLYMLPAWREATVYTEAERAALALTEAVTLIAGTHVPEDVEIEARRNFDSESYAAHQHVEPPGDHLPRRAREVSASPRIGAFVLIGTWREDPR